MFDVSTVETGIVYLKHI